MKINFVKQFRSCFGVLLITLALSYEIVLFSEGFGGTEFCKSVNEYACVILCKNWDLGLQRGGFNEILETEGKKYKSCTLILEGCTNTKTTWEFTLNGNPNIEDLKIIHTPIDLNQLNLNVFKNLRSLTIENTTTESLRLKTFLQLPKLRQLYVKNTNLIKWVDQSFIKNLTLDYIQIFDITINQLSSARFLKNLTGRPDIPEIYALDFFKNSTLMSCDFEFKFKVIREKERKDLTNYKISCANFDNPKKREFLSQNCTLEKPSSEVGDCKPHTSPIHFLPIVNNLTQKFTVTNEEPEVIDIKILDRIYSDKVFFWYWNYENTTSPKFNCIKIPRQKFKMQVTPNSEYLMCLATIFHSQIEVFSCLPFKTKPPYEEQPWLTNKSIPFSIIFVTVMFLFALTTGALILYLSVRKNPSLIRGSKRVIEVKTHDKAQVLIMPRGYESPNQPEATPLVLANPRLQPSFSCDTVSTVSYVSAHQPTQLEILNYRLTRLRELFQRNNNLPPPIPMHVATPVSRRLPPHVDLLLEYEWYTITTTTEG